VLRRVQCCVDAVSQLFLSNPYTLLSAAAAASFTLTLHHIISWRLVHESLPLKGRQYNELPAAVLEVSEASLCGSYSVQFMCALGCEITHRVVRRSYVFVCSHEDVEVQVGPAASVMLSHGCLPVVCQAGGGGALM
jgi:hypothetical protein